MYTPPNRTNPDTLKNDEIKPHADMRTHGGSTIIDITTSSLRLEHPLCMYHVLQLCRTLARPRARYPHGFGYLILCPLRCCAACGPSAIMR